jgi:hypothetical protein
MHVPTATRPASYHGGTMAVATESAARTERLLVRLTAEEAAQIAALAAARGLTVSDLIREAVLKRSAHRRRVGRRPMCAEAALAIRELSAIGANLQKLVEIVRDLGVIPQTQLDAGLIELSAAIAGLGR